MTFFDKIKNYTTRKIFQNLYTKKKKKITYKTHRNQPNISNRIMTLKIILKKKKKADRQLIDDRLEFSINSMKFISVLSLFNARIVQPSRKVIFHRNEPARARNSIHRLVFSSCIHKHGSFIISYKLRRACASNIAFSSGTNQ